MTEPVSEQVWTSGAALLEAAVDLLLTESPADLPVHLADTPPGPGRPPPAHLTIIATLGAVEGRLGALPAQLVTTGQPATLTTAQLRRMACHSDLDAVLLDGLGNPVGASHTRRNLTRRERRALRAQWGSTCAVAGCPNTITVPHHVEPFWLRAHPTARHHPGLRALPPRPPRRPPHPSATRRPTHQRTRLDQDSLNNTGTRAQAAEVADPPGTPGIKHS